MKVAGNSDLPIHVLNLPIGAGIKFALNGFPGVPIQ